MLLAFSAASIVVEVIYRLFPIPLVMFPVSNLLLKRRLEEPIYWTLAILTSLLEPLERIPIWCKG